MQTKPEAEVGTLSGARQVPLMRADQIVPGVMFTGIAADHVHEVLSVTGTRMTTRFVPAKPTPQDHTHAFNQHGGASCRCGVNQYEIQPFLPEDGTTPKVHLLVPVGPVQPLAPYTLYLLRMPNGNLVVKATNSRGVSPSPAPNADLPVIVRGARIWSLPDAARALMQEEDNNDESPSED